MNRLKSLRRVVPAAAAGLVLAVGSPVFAQTTPPTIDTYTDAVGIESLIESGGMILAGIIATALVLTFAMVVVRVAVRKFAN